jgi:hypothetical protein
MDDSMRQRREADGLDERPFEADAAVEGDEDTSRRTAGIRMEIEETRAELAETVEAIEQKLRPSAVMARAADSVKETAAAGMYALTDAAGETVRTAGSAAQRVVARTRDSAGGLMGIIRDNPVPAALVAVGAGWLLANARGRRQDNAGSDVRTATEGYAGTEPYWREMNTHTRQGLDVAAVRRGGYQVRAHLRRMTSENPLLVGAGALLIGAAFGLALPETESENALMGDARDSLVDRAQQAASDAAGRLKDQASRVAGAAGDVADSLAPRSET